MLRLIRGELVGLGLDAELREDAAPAAVSAAPNGAYGALIVEASDSVLSVRAFAPGDPKPVVESIDLDSAGVDAEVAAVRAVETLRAALLPFAQAHRAELSAAARDFARVRELPDKPAASTARPATRPAPATRGERRARTPWVELAIGPSLSINANGPLLLGAQGGLLVGPSWGFLALTGESTLYRGELDGAAGHAELARRALAAELGARLWLGARWELTGRAGMGYSEYAVHGVAKPAYLAQDLRHHTAFFACALGGAYYFVPELGVFLLWSGQLSLDAARIRIAGRDVGTLDQPSSTLAAGLLLGVL